MALSDFVKSITKSALLAHLKNVDQKTMKWRKDLLDAVVTKDELDEWSSGGGVDHGSLTGLGDDDHTQYILGNRTYWTDLTDSGATTLHKHDHGGMDGLTDDDHSQYILVNGTRAFSAVVGGVDPTAPSHLATKEYVDISTGIRSDYYFTDTASDIGGIYYYQTVANPGGAGTTLASGSLGTGDGQAFVNFITVAGEPGTTTLKAGVYHAHAHIEKTAGTKPAKVYFEVYKRILAGTETLIATSEISGYITTLDDFDLHAAVLTDVDILVTDRVVIKWLANIEATGSNATLTMSLEGTYASRLEVPTNTEILSSVFVRRDGTTALSADWDAGSFEIRAQTFESDVTTGTAPLTVASTTEVTNLNTEFFQGLGLSGTPASEIDEFLTYFDSGSYISVTGSGYNQTSFLPRLMNDASVTMTVYNNTGSQIDALSVCYISGDNSGTPLITLADADAEATASNMLVVASANIANAASGTAIIYGWVGGLSGLTAGAIQYLSTTDGGMTETAPSATGDIVRIVGYAMSTTEMFFNPDKTYIELV